jgi:L-threonylcarbamoyladenylate synthase
METIHLSDNEGIASIKSSGVLRSGGVILYPTDTLYGLGADAFSDTAVDKIYAIKGRDPRKPIHAIFSDMKMVEEYAEVSDLARKLAEKFLPGALTLVLKKKSGVETGIARNIETIGVRIPDNSFCIETARSFDKPFTATSANLANEPTQLSVEKVIAQLGDTKNKIDLIIDAGILPMRQPSTVVSLLHSTPVILREGAISKEEIESVLK